MGKKNVVMVVKPSFRFETRVNGQVILHQIERYARTCYKSEKRMGRGYSPEFVRSLIASGHESVIEHVVVTVRIICDRGVSHEWVRHRLASYSQESTRYCNYGKASKVRMIQPFFFLDEKDKKKYQTWLEAMEFAAQAYLKLLELGASPQEARSVLPNSLKTEFVVTFNLREWRHFFRLRCSPRAHPQMREIAIPLLKEFQRRIPIIFDDIASE